MTTIAPRSFEAASFYSPAPVASRCGGTDRVQWTTVAMFALVATVAVLGLAAAIFHAAVPPLSVDDLSPLLGL